MTVATETNPATSIPAPNPAPAPKAPVAAPDGGAPRLSADAQTALKALLEAAKAKPEPAPVDDGRADKAEVAALKAEVAQLREHRERAEAQVTWDTEKARVKASVVDASEDYVMLQAVPEALDMVLQHRTSHYQATGEVITEEVAAQAVENQLRMLAERIAPAASKVRRPAPKAAPSPRRPTESPEPKYTLPDEADLDREFLAAL